MSERRDRHHRQNSQSRPRSTSRSRPTTPLRPSSRSSFRDSARSSVQGDTASFPLNAFEPAFAELSDAMADLEANMMHFQLMHESLARFSESFASFLYGLNMNAFCVDFPEGPMAESFRRMKAKEEEDNQRIQLGGSASQERPTGGGLGGMENETTFMTTDTSFVDNPPTASKPTLKFQTPARTGRQSRVPPPAVRGTSSSTRGGTTTRGGRGGTTTGTGTRGAKGTGIARGTTRGRGGVR
ncbi:DASH complex subunit DAM1 [Podospora fimiseda]|uniref:DASH complex subunit DAM1 n=1 Tax=Podospora fimiseda TaxID=252190 RepID=A0AAN7BYD4_9PEZI|nr:DASH complex subunit DAM1 [Podospora fimiseda]